MLYECAPIFPLRKRDHCIGVRIGYARGTHQAITLSVKPDEGGCGARPFIMAITWHCQTTQKRVLDHQLLTLLIIVDS